VGDWRPHTVGVLTSCCQRPSRIAIGVVSDSVEFPEIRVAFSCALLVLQDSALDCQRTWQRSEC